MGLGIPITFATLSCNDKRINTHLEHNASSMENIGHPLPLHEWYRHIKRKFIFKRELAHTNLLRTARKYRIYVGMVDSYGKTWFKDFGCKYYFCLVQVVASKKIEKQPTQKQKSHK